jgi:RNA polymerase sigma factor (sigma-70 family)
MEKFNSTYLRSLFHSIYLAGHENAVQKIQQHFNTLSSFEAPEFQLEREEEILYRRAEEPKANIHPSIVRFSRIGYSSEDIIVGILAEDSDVLQHLYDHFFPRIKNFILHHSGTSIQAEDIFSEALVLMLEKNRKGTLHFIGHPENWLYSVCHNLWRNELRKKGKKLDDRTFETETDPIEPDPEPDHYAICREEIGKLGTKCRELLFQTIYEQKKIGEIAGPLGYANPHSASTQKRKCLERLSKSVKERLQEMPA